MGALAGQELPGWFWDSTPGDVLVAAARELGLVDREETDPDPREGEEPAVKCHAAAWVVSIVRGFRHGTNPPTGVLGLRRGAADPEWRAAFEAAEAFSRIQAAELVYALDEGYVP